MFDELSVAQMYAKTCFPLAHRWKTRTCEIDLLFYEPRLKYIKMIEVKSKSQGGFEYVRLSIDQRRRLLGARKFLESFAPGGCQLLIVQAGLQGIEELPITAWRT